jgi:carboxymethylenebutenolidase
MNTIPRRSLLGGIAMAPLAAILADPRLAARAAESTETVSLTTKGGRQVTGALAPLPAQQAGAVVLIHEWWGLNDQIKAVAVEFAKEGFVALAADLYGGKVGADRAEAEALMKQVDAEAATDTLVSWVDWLRGHERGNGKVGTVGWCFGGGWSLNASIAAPVDATVVYYGRVNQPASELAKLKGPVLGHFATLDKFINQAMVDEYEAGMREAGRPFETHWYEADHAFANPSGGRYDREDAQAAWARTLEFLRANLA